MRSRTDILDAYGVPDFHGAAAEGDQIRICCTTGRMAWLRRPEAEKLAAELVLAGAMEDFDELSQALVGE